MTQENKPRQWKIIGGLRLYERPNSPPGNCPENFIEGPLLKLGESVVVREVRPDSVDVTREQLRDILVNSFEIDWYTGWDFVEKKIFGDNK